VHWTKIGRVSWLAEASPGADFMNLHFGHVEFIKELGLKLQVKLVTKYTDKIYTTISNEQTP
jgi:hypothetical protein